MFNLYSQLNELDNKQIENYIGKFGILPNSYIGNREWLKYWGRAKIKLYKLLGNKMRYQFEENSAKQMLDVLKNDLISRINIDFPDLLETWDKYCDEIEHKLRDAERYEVKTKQGWPLTPTFKIFRLIKPEKLIANKTDYDLRIKDKVNNKTLAFDENCKIFKALNKVIEFFDASAEIKDMIEKLREVHSQVMGQPHDRTTITLSIHPLDFITLSDNSSWTSCLNWSEKGCYSLGATEMLNSNNVICAYISTQTPYYFDPDYKDKEHSCPNKIWRQLFFVTPDIIVGGKAYNYQNNFFTKIILRKLRELALVNLHWSYESEIEKYNDMFDIRTLIDFNAVRTKIRKKNYGGNQDILFDTKAMYNDMFYDHSVTYYCIRNSIPHTKIICYSGKAPCLCCMKTVYELPRRKATCYNERFLYTGKLICKDCKDKYYCQICEVTDKHRNVERIKVTKKDEKRLVTIAICPSCLSKSIFECPDCGKPTFLDRSEYNTEFEDCIWAVPDFPNDMPLQKNKLIIACEDCQRKMGKKNMIKLTEGLLESHKDYKMYCGTNPEKYYLENITFIDKFNANRIYQHALFYDGEKK